MSLLSDHKSLLSITLKDPDFFGVDIVLIDTNDIEYKFKGQCNIISKHFSVELGADVSGERANVTIALEDFLEKTSIDLDDIKTEIENWKVRTSPQPETQAAKTYIIEMGQIFPDHHLGIITFFLTEVTII